MTKPRSLCLPIENAASHRPGWPLPGDIVGSPSSGESMGCRMIVEKVTRTLAGGKMFSDYGNTICPICGKDLHDMTPCHRCQACIHPVHCRGCPYWINDPWHCGYADAQQEEARRREYELTKKVRRSRAGPSHR